MSSLQEKLQVRALTELSTSHEALTAEKALLTRRLSCARRRLASIEPSTRTSEVFLGTPAAIVAMRARLAATADDEPDLLALVAELRDTKEALTTRALNLYAARTARFFPE